MLEKPHAHRDVQGFNDHQTRHQRRLQELFKQQMPSTLDGGREVLWWCPCCRHAWYERGYYNVLLRLSPAQVDKLMRELSVESEPICCLPRVICPNCTTRYLGGVPRIEEFHNGRGYRLTWKRAKSSALFLYTVYAGSLSSERVQVALSSATDLPLTSPVYIQALLDWLMVLPDPAWDQIIPLNDDLCSWLDRRYQPPAQFVWSGYAWSSPASPLGTVLLIMATTFSNDACCPPEFLVACWRQIAQGMRYIL